MEGLETAMEIQRQQGERFRALRTSGPIHRRASIPFNNPQAQKFFVDGSSIPDVNFDAGPSWAGLLPISAASGESRRLFFWLWPTTNPAKSKELVFWTNGIALLSLFQPFSHIIQVAPAAPLSKVSCRKMALSRGPGVNPNPPRTSPSNLMAVC